MKHLTDLWTLRRHLERLGLNQASRITSIEREALIRSLLSERRIDLASLIESLSTLEIEKIMQDINWEN